MKVLREACIFVTSLYFHFNRIFHVVNCAMSVIGPLAADGYANISGIFDSMGFADAND